MAIYRIDIKSSNDNSVFLNRLLKWLVFCYIILVSLYLFYKLFTLFQQHTSKKEWAAILVNLLIVAILSLQLIRTSIRKYILVTDDYVRYRWRFPWASHFEWNKIKTIQLGYSSVRFVTTSNKKYRFYFYKATEQEKANLQEALIAIARKRSINFVQPLQEFTE
ncbi:MAG TPA: hypothetical protein VKR32_13575 [Puia sp.]|nr:hypothetical protein [Puia sp.]